MDSIEQPLIDFHRRRDFGTKLGITFDFIRTNFKSFFRTLIFIAGPPILIGSALQATFYGDFVNSIVGGSAMGGTEALQELMFTGNFWFQFVAMLLLFSLSSVITISVIYNYMFEYEEKQTTRIELNGVWERVKNSLGLYLGTFLLNLVLFFGAGIVMVVIMALLMTVSGFIAFLVGFSGFLYAAVTLSMIFIVRAYEKIGYFESISRCFYLIRGKWWSTFGLLFVFGLLQVVINWVLYLPFSILGFVSAMHSLEVDQFGDPSAGMTTIATVLSGLSFFTGFLLSSLSTIGLAFQYFNLVEMKEARGLLSKIDSIGESPSVDRNEDY